MATFSYRSLTIQVKNLVKRRAEAKQPQVPQNNMKCRRQSKFRQNRRKQAAVERQDPVSVWLGCPASPIFVWLGSSAEKIISSFFVFVLGAGKFSSFSFSFWARTSSLLFRFRFGCGQVLFNLVFVLGADKFNSVSLPFRRWCYYLKDLTLTPFSSLGTFDDIIVSKIYLCRIYVSW